MLFPFEAQVAKVKQALKQEPSADDFWFWTLYTLSQFQDFSATCEYDQDLVHTLLVFLNCPVVAVTKSTLLYIVCESGFFQRVHHDIDQALQRALVLPEQASAAQPSVHLYHELAKQCDKLVPSKVTP
jgi:hypothetical protein